MLLLDSWMKNSTLTLTDVTFSVTDTDYFLEESDNDKENVCKRVIYVGVRLCSSLHTNHLKYM